MAGLDDDADAVDIGQRLEGTERRVAKAGLDPVKPGVRERARAPPADLAQGEAELAPPACQRRSQVVPRNAGGLLGRLSAVVARRVLLAGW
jgi:hypothetical protein